MIKEEIDQELLPACPKCERNKDVELVGKEGIPIPKYHCRYCGTEWNEGKPSELEGEEMSLIKIAIECPLCSESWKLEIQVKFKEIRESKVMRRGIKLC